MGGLKFEGVGRPEPPMCASVQQSSDPNRLLNCQTFYGPIFKFEYHFFNVLKMHNKARINFLSRYELIFLPLKIIKLSHSYFLRFWIL